MRGAWSLFNERDAKAASIDNTTMAVAVRPAIREPPPQPNTFIYAALYIKLKTTLEVIFVLGWWEFIQQYQFNELDDRISKLEKGQNVTKTTEETAVELDREMSMDAELIGKFITQQVAAAMADKSKKYEKKIKIWRKVEKIECRESRHQKTVRGAVDTPPRKTTPLDSNDHQVKTTTEICVSIGTRPKDYPLNPLDGNILKSRQYRQWYARKREKKESSALQKRIDVNQADLENRRR